jgi:hypothetical protein
MKLSDSPLIREDRNREVRNPPLTLAQQRWEAPERVAERRRAYDGRVTEENHRRDVHYRRAEERSQQYDRAGVNLEVTCAIM